eukprot:4649253-Pyramimonas_sp.AAC.1
MTEAAQLVRDDWVRQTTGDANKAGYLAGRVFTARSISRAVWRQDLQLARRVASTTELGAQYLNIVNGTVTIRDPIACASIAAQLHRDFGARQLSLAQQAAQRPQGQDGAMHPARFRRVQRTSQRRALLWAPWKRRL